MDEMSTQPTTNTQSASTPIANHIITEARLVAGTATAVTASTLAAGAHVLHKSTGIGKGVRNSMGVIAAASTAYTGAVAYKHLKTGQS